MPATYFSVAKFAKTLVSGVGHSGAWVIRLMPAYNAGIVVFASSQRMNCRPHSAGCQRLLHPPLVVADLHGRVGLGLEAQRQRGEDEEVNQGQERADTPPPYRTVGPRRGRKDLIIGPGS